MDFVNRLKPEHLDSFWYFASATNFALISTFGSLLRATAPGHEEGEFYRNRLKEYRWALGVSSRRAEWLDSAVKMMDVTEQLLEHLPEKSRSVRTSPVPMPMPMSMSTMAYTIPHDFGDEMEEDFDEEEEEEDYE